MKPILLLVAFCLSYISTLAQTAWSVVYDHHPHTLIVNSGILSIVADDTAILAAGNTGTFNSYSFLAAYNYSGTLLSSRPTYANRSFNNMTGPSSLQKVKPNKYLACCNSHTFGMGGKLAVYNPILYYFNTQLDSLGLFVGNDTIVSRMVYSCLIDDKKNAILSGFATSKSIAYNSSSDTYKPDSIYAWIVKYDSNANLIWEKKFDGTKTSNGFYPIQKVIKENNGSGYVVCGTTFQNTLGAIHYIANIDENGTLVWKKQLALPFNESYQEIDISASSSGGYIFNMTVDTLPLQPIADCMYFGKVDHQGDLVWGKVYAHEGRATYGNQVIEAGNDDLMLLNTANYPDGPHSILLRTSKDGIIKWSRDYKHLKNVTQAHGQGLKSMALTQSRQLILGGFVGVSESIPGVIDSPGTYSWLMLTDTFGCMQPGCEAADTMWHTNVADVNGAIDISIYPNPAQNTLYIKTGSLTGTATATLTDMQGRSLQTTTLQSNTQHSTDISQLPPGMYLLTIKQQGAVLQRIKVSHY